MSIYGSTFSVGEVSPVWDDDNSPGVVLWRGIGGRNDWPIDGEHYHRLSISGATIPAWCVPGHQGHEDPRNPCCDGYATPGPWYRLGIYDEPPFDGPQSVEALLDEDAVRSLRDALTDWLDKPKARPTEETA